MSFEEKSAWLHGVISVVAYIVYLAILLPMVGIGGISSVAYELPLLATIVGAIIAAIIGSIALAVSSPRSAGQKDQRDRQIYRFGEYTGQSFVVIGGVAALLMALAQWDTFWIANVIYLCFVLSAILSTIAKAVAYRRGMPEW
ncbi:MAG: hypothetical protein LH471_01855 [Salinibacterium sp.]|nr:hypothetical protein [Salinibacterium sp.]